MVISFDAKNIDGKFTTFNIMMNKRSVLKFPMDGVDVEYDYHDDIYRIFFDTEITLDKNHNITPTIEEVKRSYLRKQKINKIIKR